MKDFKVALSKVFFYWQSVGCVVFPYMTKQSKIFRNVDHTKMFVIPFPPVEGGAGDNGENY